MRTLARPDDQPLLEALARYIAEMHTFVRDPEPRTLARLDDAFADLRTLQQCEWPELGASLDATGAAACDLVRALHNPPAAGDHRALLMVHDRAIARLVEALAPLAA